MVFFVRDWSHKDRPQVAQCVWYVILIKMDWFRKDQSCYWERDLHCALVIREQLENVRSFPHDPPHLGYYRRWGVEWFCTYTMWLNYFIKERVAQSFLLTHFLKDTIFEKGWPSCYIWGRLSQPFSLTHLSNNTIMEEGWPHCYSLERVFQPSYWHTSMRKLSWMNGGILIISQEGSFYASSWPTYLRML